LLLHFLSLMLGSVLVLMLPLLVWLTPDLRIKKSLLKCNWTIRKRLPRCKMRLKKRLLAFSRRLHARIRNDQTSLGQFSGRVQQTYKHSVPRFFVPEHGTMFTLALVRFPPTATKEI